VLRNITRMQIFVNEKINNCKGRFTLTQLLPNIVA
jgi:hypothetical protein